MKKTEETKKAIVNVAIKLFNTLGYDKTSMDDIARFANKAKRSLYYHFTSKEEIFQTAVQQEIQQLEEQLGDLFNDTTKPAPEIFNTYFIKRMEILSKSKVYKIMLGYELQQDKSTFPLDGFHTVLREFEEWEYEHYLKLCSTIKERDDYNPRALTSMLLMLTKSLDITFFVQGRYAEYKDTLNIMVQTITHGMVQVINSNNNSHTI